MVTLVRLLCWATLVALGVLLSTALMRQDGPVLAGTMLVLSGHVWLMLWLEQEIADED